MAFVVQQYCFKCKAILPGGSVVNVDPLTGFEIGSGDSKLCVKCQKREETK